MIVALMIGRAGSRGFPGKNTKKILGKHLCEFPLLACKKSKFVEKIYVSTDDSKIKKIAKKYDAEFIERPKKLNNSKALGDHVFEFGYFEIKNRLKKLKKKIDFLVLLFANGATINSNLIDNGIKILKRDKFCDSAVSTSVYNMWSPLRARKLNSKGYLKPFVPFKTFGNPMIKTTIL